MQEELKNFHEHLSKMHDMLIIGDIKDFFDRGPQVHLKKMQEGYRIAEFNLLEQDNNIIATFELPGVEKKDIELNLQKNTIQISTHFNIESSKNYFRQVTLPAEIDPDKVKAKFENGLLKVEMGKNKGMKINIE